jgi:hypothetical protein
VLRFALHRQGQNSQVSTRCHGMPCRSSLLVLLNSVGLGYRPTGLNVQPSTDRRKGFLPALNDRVSEQESDDCVLFSARAKPHTPVSSVTGRGHSRGEPARRPPPRLR